MYDQYRQQQIAPTYLPSSVISDYVNQWIVTSIPTYGQVVAYVTDFNRRNGMVSMFIYPAPHYQPQFIRVHHSDLIGISPYYGPIPPRPSHQPSPWNPRPPHPGHQHGGGFWPWLIGQAFGGGNQGHR